jgi:hypothetical protein
MPSCVADAGDQRQDIAVFGLGFGLAQIGSERTVNCGTMGKNGVFQPGQFFEAHLCRRCAKRDRSFALGCKYLLNG